MDSQSQAVAALLSLQEPIVRTGPVLKPPAMVTPAAQQSNHQQRLAKQLKLLLDNGFRAADLSLAKYPRPIVQWMTHIEQMKGILLRPRSNFELAPYNTVQYFTSTGPHVLCPACHKACVLRKDKSFRKHACIRKVSTLNRGSVSAAPILATVVRSCR